MTTPTLSQLQQMTRKYDATKKAYDEAEDITDA